MYETVVCFTMTPVLLAYVTKQNLFTYMYLLCITLLYLHIFWIGLFEHTCFVSLPKHQNFWLFFGWLYMYVAYLLLYIFFNKSNILNNLSSNQGAKSNRILIAFVCKKQRSEQTKYNFFNLMYNGKKRSKNKTNQTSKEVMYYDINTYVNNELPTN